MKKLFSISLLLSIAITGYSQGFYVRLGLGYAIPQAGQTMDGTAQPYNGTLNNNTSQYSINSASFSAGVGTALAAGYMFSDHIGVQLDANVGLSNKQYTFTETNYSYGGVPSDVNVVQQAKSLFMLSPSLVLQTGGKVNLYTRFGLALPINSKITQDQIITTQAGYGAITSYDFAIDVKNSFSIGFTGATGVRYKLNDRVSLWGELSILSMGLYIKQSEVVGFSVDGQAQSLTSISGSLITNYSKNVVADTNGNNRPAYSQPFSNLGVNFGVSFQLSEGSSSRHSGGRRNDEDIDPNKPFRRR